MSQIVKLEDGTEIETFTQEEIEAQKQEAIEAYKADNPDKTDELTALQEELKKKEEALEKASDKSTNLANLRKAKEDAEKKVADLLVGFDEKINTVKKEVMEGVMKDHYNDILKAFSGDDPEIAKKVEFHYKRLGDVASTKDEITNKLKDAYVLATKDEGGNFDSRILSSGGVSRINIKSQDKKFSSEEKELAAKLGLSEKDLK